MLHKLFSHHAIPINILAGPFKGAKVLLNPAHSKRQIFGLYEYVVNSWILEKMKGKTFAMDVGANNGYHTYGFAHLLKINGVKNPVVLSFEPASISELYVPETWDEYADCRIQIIKKFVGEKTSNTEISLDDAYSHYLNRSDDNKGLIKIDIEGSEVAALSGAAVLLDDKRHDWLIEIHGKELIPIVANHFVRRNRPFLIKDLAPIPCIGPEKRSDYTAWLVTL